MRKIVAEAIVLRVAARHQMAFEFPSPKALKNYLKEHPKADKSKHTVQPKAEPDSKDAPKAEPEHKEAPKRSWKDVLKGVSEAAVSFVKSSPKAVRDFVSDEGFRRDALMKAHTAVVNAPEAFVKGVIREAKHEAKEIKEAGHGLSAVLRGKKMTEEQKHALKKVATHVAIATAATALTGGLALGAAGLAKGTAGAFVSSLAKKVALRSVSQQLGALPTVEELGHAGHGAAHTVKHLFDHFTTHLASGEELDPEDVFAAFVAAAVAKGLKELDPDTVAEAIEDAAKESST